MISMLGLFGSALKWGYDIQEIAKTSETVEIFRESEEDYHKKLSYMDALDVASVAGLILMGTGIVGGTQYISYLNSTVDSKEEENK